MLFVWSRSFVLSASSNFECRVGPVLTVGSVTANNNTGLYVPLLTGCCAVVSSVEACLTYSSCSMSCLLSTVQPGCGLWPRRWGFGAPSACGRPPFGLHVRSQWCSFAVDLVRWPGQHELMGVRWYKGTNSDWAQCSVALLMTDVPHSHQANGNYRTERLKLCFTSVLMSLNEALSNFGQLHSRGVDFKDAVTQSKPDIWNQKIEFFYVIIARSCCP